MCDVCGDECIATKISERHKKLCIKVSKETSISKWKAGKTKSYRSGRNTQKRIQTHITEERKEKKKMENVHKIAENRYP